MSTKISSIKEYRFKDNPKEQEFFENFVEQFEKNNNMDLIVFGQSSRPGTYPNDYLTEREREIVASTIQWLGSHVGQGFLDRCGFESKERRR